MDWFQSTVRQKVILWQRSIVLEESVLLRQRDQQIDNLASFTNFSIIVDKHSVGLYFLTGLVTFEYYLE